MDIGILIMLLELVDDISTTFDVMDNATTVLQSTYYHSVIIDLLIHLYIYITNLLLFLLLHDIYISE